MPTTPKLLPEEAPLDAAAVDRFLTSMGTDMVLVGGQALAFWMERFGLRPHDAVISNDGDALGGVKAAQILAGKLKADLLQPRMSSRTSLVAQLRMRTASGRLGNIDVLHQLYTVSGLKKSSEFTRRVDGNAIQVEWRPGHFIRIMDPFDVLDSRVQNAAGLLDEKGPHVLTQARWAIEVAKIALAKLAADPAPSVGRLEQMLQGVFKLAASRAGKKLLREHSIDVLDAVDVDELSKLSPEHHQQLARLEAARDARKSAV